MAKRTPVNKARVMESAMRGREEFFIAVHPCIWVRIFRARPAGHFPNARKRIPEAASFYDSGVVAGSMDAGSCTQLGSGLRERRVVRGIDEGRGKHEERGSHVAVGRGQAREMTIRSSCRAHRNGWLE